MEKALVIRLSSIGDIIVCTPVIRSLALQKKAEVHVVVKKAFQGVLSANPYVSRIHLYEEELESDYEGLKSVDFDFIVDLHKNMRSYRIKKALGIRSFDFDKLNLKKWLAVNFKMHVLPKKYHLVDRYFEGLKMIELENDGEGLDFFISEKAINVPNEPFVTVALGAAHATKMIPEDQLTVLFDKLRFPIVLLGGPSEKELGERIDLQFGHVTNHAGNCTIPQSADLIQKSSVLITPDTGMMHIGAALKKPMAVMWGNTIPEFGMYPYYGDYDIQVKNMEVELRCRPCSKIGFPRCPKGHFKCMKNQDLDALVDWVTQIWHSTNMVG